MTTRWYVSVLSDATDNGGEVFVGLNWRTITTTFNNMQTLKFKAQPTNLFSATINPMLRGGSSQLPTTSEHCFVVWTVLNDLITACLAVVGGWEEPPKIWLVVAKNAFVGWALNFKVCMLLKGAVAHGLLTVSEPHINRKPLSIICSMLSRGILKHFPCCKHLL